MLRLLPDAEPFSPYQISEWAIQVKCINCGIEVSELYDSEDARDILFFSTPCDDPFHFFCTECVADHYQDSLKAKEGWFPHCCNVYYSAKEVAVMVRKCYAQANDEKTTPELDKTNPENNVYCIECNKLITYPNWKMSLARCLDCAIDTCTRCRAQEHQGDCAQKEECPEMKKVNKLAISKGWKKCSKCGQVIEKVGGCHWVLCQCGTWSCYRCGIAAQIDDHADHVCSPPQRQQGSWKSIVEQVRGRLTKLIRR